LIPSVLPAWLFDFATAAILFILGCQLGGLRAASIATAVFMLDPITYETWVSGRYDSLFVLMVVAAILLSR
jgi:Gpi18-like mannosyltransferase